MVLAIDSRVETGCPAVAVEEIEGSKLREVFVFGSWIRYIAEEVVNPTPVGVKPLAFAVKSSFDMDKNGG